MALSRLHALALCTAFVALSACGEDPPCGASTPDGLRSCVEEARLRDDLRFIASPRDGLAEADHWQAVQDRCAERLRSLGYRVTHQLFEGPERRGVNVLGFKEGVQDEWVIVAAHYDHVPGCDGADDNASGVAGALELARVLAHVDARRSLLIALWDQEEDGTLGSRTYAREADTGNQRIRANYTFEMIGYADSSWGAQEVPLGLALIFPAQSLSIAASGFAGDFLAIVHGPWSQGSAEALERHAAAVDLPHHRFPVSEQTLEDAAYQDLRRTDHDPFWQLGYPAMMLTDTANFRNRGYHCGERMDDFEHIDFGFATRVVRATVGAAAEDLDLLGAAR